MLEALLFLPLGAGCIILLGTKAMCRVLLPLTALGHTALAAWTTHAVGTGAEPRAMNGLLAPDPLGALFLMLASLLFLAASLYAVYYLREEDRLEVHTDIHGGPGFTNAPQRRLAACLCFFLSSMTLVTTTPHLGALWVGIEGTTLSSAPLIYFHRHQRSLEATWKYLIICSVGIALAMVGNILLSVAFYTPEGMAAMVEGMDQLGWFVSHARAGEETWLKAAYIFLLVGYGTKMGLAPLHNWLPDAHSQAPSLVSALLSGALLNCALLGILRGHQIMLAAGAMLHAVCHSLTKCMLFLLSGNILARYHTFSSYDVRGMRWTMPITGALWMAGFLAVAGSPPFGIFISEFIIFKGMLAAGSPLLAAAYLLALAVIFVGLSVAVLRMVQGNRPTDMPQTLREPLLSVLPPLVLGLAVLTLGLWIPDWLWNFLRQGAALIGG